MNHKERFTSIFTGRPFDRIPVYFFGTWRETKLKWKDEGCANEIDLQNDCGPQLDVMDPDWEKGLWDCHGLVNNYLVGDEAPVILEEAPGYITKRHFTGDIIKESKTGSSIPHVIEYGLTPERKSWQRYRCFLDPEDKRRRPADWEKKAQGIAGQDRVLAFMGGSLYGWLRNWMGVEGISYLMYDDPVLFEEIVEYLSDYQMKIFAPVLKELKFEIAYFFEDCCGVNGPLFPPRIYKTILDKYYRKLIGFYKDNDVALTLIDSDGSIDELIPFWTGSGFDIIFPFERGAFGADPLKMRSRFPNTLKIFGGVDKHVIPKGKNAVREHLLPLRDEVKKGGFIPMPDHRIPPDCSYEAFFDYIEVFDQVFNNT